MKVIVFVKATKASEAGEMPSERLLKEMGAFNEELVKAGVMLAGEGLHPSSKAARVRFSGTERLVIEGPFAETKELVAGYWIWQVKSLQDAIDWLKKCPNPMPEDSEIEIRPIFEMEDFGDAMTPELRAQETRLRESLDGTDVARPRFEMGKALTIAGMNQHYTQETTNQIPAQWDRFAPSLGRIPGQIGKMSYGVCWNFAGDCDFDYLAGVEVAPDTKLPVDYSQVQLAARRYAVFTHNGPVSTLPKMIHAVWSQWLPNSGLKTASAPCFERYNGRIPSGRLRRHGTVGSAGGLIVALPWHVVGECA